MTDVFDPTHKVIIDMKQNQFNFYSKSCENVQNINNLKVKL